MKQETLTFSADCTVCIVGLGLMGGSFAKRFKQIGVKRIIAIDTDEAVLNMASADGVADEILSTGTAALAEAQIILFCLPLAATARFIVENGKFFVPGQVITDIIGIKQDSVEDVSNLLPDYVDYVPAHPMAGREGRGYAMSRAEIFEGANYIIVPTANSSTAAVRMVKAMAVAGRYGGGTLQAYRLHEFPASYSGDQPGKQPFHECRNEVFYCRRLSRYNACRRYKCRSLDVPSAQRTGVGADGNQAF